MTTEAPFMPFEAKSEYRDSVIFYWRGNIGINEAVLDRDVASTLRIDELSKIKANALFEQKKESNPRHFNGQLLRYEGHLIRNGQLAIQVSYVYYMDHDYLRTVEGLRPSQRALPIGVTALQVTSDGFIVAAVNGDDCDLSGVGTLGSGHLHKRHVTVLNCFNEEAQEETLYEGDKPDFTKARVIGISYGADKFAFGIVTMLDIPNTSQQIRINWNNRQEHRGILLIKNDKSVIEAALRSGKFQGISLTDQTVGGLELICGSMQSD